MSKKLKTTASLLLLLLVAFNDASGANKNMENYIEKTHLFKSHSDKNTSVEIWDDDYIEDGWEYYSIVSNNNGVVRKLEYIRIKDGIIQQRTYDSNGDDLWLEAK